MADWAAGYGEVNRQFANAVIRELRLHGTHTPVLFQDYHVYLAAEHVRAQIPEARLSHVSYIPWPDERYWRMVPRAVPESIYRSMASNDVIGFQTAGDERNFVDGVSSFLPNATQAQWDARSCQGILEQLSFSLSR